MNFCSICDKFYLKNNKLFVTPLKEAEIAFEILKTLLSYDDNADFSL
jgi:hypothetical protein